MPPRLAQKDNIYILNHCTKYLARDNSDARHNYGQYDTDDPRATISEAWRFPIVDAYYDGKDYEASHAFNIVTFIYVNRNGRLGSDISVLGTFADLFSPVPLSQVEDSIYWAVTVVVPKGESHRYKFMVGSRAMLDPVNPQKTISSDGSQWSRFFTEYCTDSLSFERWEILILERLTNHILPFRTTEAQRFLNIYYNGLDRQDKDSQYARVYRLDQPVGATNFIDKILTRQEAHRLLDYKICLEQIDRVLRLRDPYEEPSKMPATAYEQIYNDLASDDGRSILPTTIINSGWFTRRRTISLSRLHSEPTPGAGQEA
jgi:hypothetical protein